MEARRKKIVEDSERLARELKLNKPEDYIIYNKGRPFPVGLCNPEIFQALENFEARKEDVLLAAYPKCGTIWILQVLNNIVTRFKTESKGDETDPFILFMDFETPEILQEGKKAPSPRLLSTHMHYENISASFFENKTKILLLVRNPKDVAVSYFHFHNSNPVLLTMKWDEFITKFMAGEVIYGSYFDYLLTWDKHIDEENVMVVTYEELKENLAEGVKRIVEFYGFSLSEEHIQSIADAGTFKTMKKKSKDTIPSFTGVFFRKGEVGDWKNYFSEAQSKEMDAKFEACLAGTKLGAKLKYDVYCKA